MSFSDTVERTDHPRWKYRLKSSYSFPRPPGPDRQSWECYGRSADGPRLLAAVTPARITIFPGYAWDGATGAPTWARVLRGTLEHDFGCQMQASAGFRVYIANQREVDWWLFRTASEDKFLFASVYWAAVRAYWAYKGIPQPCPDTHITGI